ncbi:5-(carboxyamino)imidazole ribonucleotide synthase [Bosea sp. BK604]|uniref:5-(carboxyamino)imidazole ribonucleotide synthase n=1 Tax=Bosea sp. BK604 TaxID=2512180 RepID=UPI0010526357|nr:5-(carboxyamino)imidazole ribonucleotide synthase [Bosea sp. BK604]TCR68279.1 5-(carboxyamino)imidazole ribonucleotide synthase [Bosea sp. BK604]
MQPSGTFGPGSVLGILGGGQLARMMAQAAADLGVLSHIYTPERESPAAEVAGRSTIAAYDDAAALRQFVESVDLVTYEFENVPAETAMLLAARKPLQPSARALAITQDRVTEKRFIEALGLPLAPFRVVTNIDELDSSLAELGRPCVLKTSRFGYDGKGQVKISAETDAAGAYAEIGGVEAVLEGLITFTKEISVIAARGYNGEFKAYDVCENEHVDHILSVTRAPARVRTNTYEGALNAARRIADALEYVGIIAIEMFVVEEGDRETFLINEIAPRVHNSGHWTSDGAKTSQFQQHVRAICNFPLGSSARLGTIEMKNLIGDAAENWREYLAEAGAHLHLYGKRESRSGRKMGHVTRVRPDENV